jgi:hypothetical protein
VEKNKAGPGVAGVPKRLDRLVDKHEIEALILAGIRGREEESLSKMPLPHPVCFP